MFPLRDHNPSGRTSWVTWGLILANVAIFLATSLLNRDPGALAGIYASYAMIPRQLAQGQGLETLVTSIFLHAGILHLAGNMLFLWIFGDNLEEEMGPGRFLLFYLACGVGAGLTHVIAAPQSLVPVVGASGAIAGVMGGYLLLFPRAKVDIILIFIVFFKIIPVPAWLMLGVWFGLQLFNGVGTDPDAGGVAYWAHAGGFLIGFAFCLPLFLRRGGPAYWSKTEGTPPHPKASYALSRSHVPRTGRRR